MIPTVLAQLARGFAMGAADVVPGVSGGTVALVLGIYEKLVATVRDGARVLGHAARGDLRGALRRFTALDFVFLVPLVVGIGLAVVALASIIERQLEENAEAMAGLFFGLVAASVVVAWDRLRERDGLHLAIMAVVGVAVFVLLGLQSGPVADPSPVVFVGSGALAICAMILPGISGSFILLMIGMYAAVLDAVHDRDLVDLALTGAGAVVGLALFSTVLARLLGRHHDTVMAVLIGLMLGSLRVLWPWPNGVGIISDDADEVVSGTGIEWPVAGDLFAPTAIAVVAFAAVIVVSRWATRHGHPLA